MYIDHFLTAFVISLVGSLPLGVLNLTTVEIALKQTILQAFYFASAAALVEFGQALIALKFSTLFADNPSLEYWINVFVVPVFLGLGLYYWFLDDEVKQKKREGFSSFGRGIMLSLINPLAIPFWVAWGTIAHANGWLVLENLPIIVFILGISLGSLATLMLFALFARLVAARVEKLNRCMNEIIGVVLFSLGLYQLYRVIWVL